MGPGWEMEALALYEMAEPAVTLYVPGAPRPASRWKQRMSGELTFVTGPLDWKLEVVRTYCQSWELPMLGKVSVCC